jgi:serine/threonine protein phosphatase PrpC
METSLQIRHVALTDTGRVRAANEDNQGHAEYYWGQVFVVCDGMGGHVGGAKASHIAVTSILEFLARDTADHPAESLRKAIAFANEQIYATALSQRELKGMGTTCVAILQKETGLWLAHVGDSRAYIYTAGKLFKLSRDHSFVQRLVDQGTIAEEDAESHPRKNELLRALGISPDVEVEVTAEPIFPKKDDVFLLCSDGLYGMTGDTGIQKVLAGAGTLEEKAQLLIDEANEGGGTDNITVQLLHVTASPHIANRYTAVKPPIHLGRTMPVEEPAGGGAAPAAQHVPIVKKYMIPLVFGIAFMLALGIFLLGNPLGTGAADKEKAIQDSIRAADSTRKAFVKDSTQLAKAIADSLAADSAAKAKTDPPAKKPDGKANPKSPQK